MLRVSLIGNLGGDPEVRFTAQGAEAITLNVAVNQSRRKPDSDEREEFTEWFRVRAGGRMANFVKRLTKGSRVLVIGRLDISHYETKDGKARIGFDVWADEVQAFAPRDNSGGNADGATDIERAPAAARPASGGGGGGYREPAARSARHEGPAADLEDLPF